MSACLDLLPWKSVASEDALLVRNRATTTANLLQKANATR